VYLRKVSAVRRASVQALRNASFCSWCLLMSCDMAAALSVPLDEALLPTAPILSAGVPPPHQSSSRLYSRSRLSNTEHTCNKNEIAELLRIHWLTTHLTVKQDSSHQVHKFITWFFPHALYTKYCIILLHITMQYLT